MSQALAIKSTDFCRQFARFANEAMSKGVIEVESRNRLAGAFLSPTEYKNYQRLKMRERQVSLVSELPDDDKTMLLNIKYGE